MAAAAESAVEALAVWNWGFKAKINKAMPEEADAWVLWRAWS